jgi:hypothetical protein
VEARRKGQETHHAPPHDARTARWVTLLCATAPYPSTSLNINPFTLLGIPVTRCSPSSLASMSDGIGPHVTDSFNSSEPETPQSSTRLSPVAEWPPNPSSPTSASLNRSRTLPSQRGGADDDRHRSRLLRKQRPHRPEGLYPGANVSA